MPPASAICVATLPPLAPSFGITLKPCSVGNSSASNQAEDFLDASLSGSQLATPASRGRTSGVFPALASSVDGPDELVVPMKTRPDTIDTSVHGLLASTVPSRSGG